MITTEEIKAIETLQEAHGVIIVMLDHLKDDFPAEKIEKAKDIVSQNIEACGITSKLIEEIGSRVVKRSTVKLTKTQKMAITDLKKTNQKLSDLLALLPGVDAQKELLSQYIRSTQILTPLLAYEMRVDPLCEMFAAEKYGKDEKDLTEEELDSVFHKAQNIYEQLGQLHAIIEERCRVDDSEAEISGWDGIEDGICLRGVRFHNPLGMLTAEAIEKRQFENDRPYFGILKGGTARLCKWSPLDEAFVSINGDAEFFDIPLFLIPVSVG